MKTSRLRSDLCDFSVTNPDNDEYDKKLVFKNNPPFVSFISKINNKLIDNAEGLDVVIPMYNY